MNRTYEDYYLWIPWAAGFIEGEGYFGLSRTGHLVVSAGNTRIELLEKLKELYGGYITRHNRSENDRKRYWRPMYSWRLSSKGTKLKYFLKSIKPFLVSKKPQCELLLEACENLKRYEYRGKCLPLKERKKREQMYWKMRKLNQRGTRPIEST